ncbi:MAG: adenylyltransferase [Gammaproteobacteria bacterium]|jgi:sulfate adenylyltransferase|nr:adenylyltransferase [Gammaproteobacteria bacterium]
MKKWLLTSRQLCDLELLLNGGFAPLTGFLAQADYNNIIKNNRLADGSLWPMPITLDVDAAFAESLSAGETIGLHGEDNTLLAHLTVAEVWCPDKNAEAQAVFGSDDIAHPGIHYLLKQAKPYYVGGTVTQVALPKHYDFTALRHTPQQLKQGFAQNGWRNIIAFQTRNPLHRAHVEMTLRALHEVEDSYLLLHPVVGMTKPGDIDHYTRVRCYQSVLPYYPQGRAALSLLPLAMRMAGPKEALWHALIRKNYGATHFIVGRDHAGPGQNSLGKPFYDVYAAQTLVKNHEKEIGLQVLTFSEMVYAKEKQIYVLATELRADETALTISGTQLRNALNNHTAIPSWFSYPEVERELRRSYKPKNKQGLTLFFTGLSGAGKSTIANALHAKLMEMGEHSIVLLDGDIVRRELASELGFSEEDRNTNIRRVGYVASLITELGGIALCAAIAPYEKIRKEIRDKISCKGGYFEIYVSTPLAVCEERDPKGLYVSARAGKIAQFTGISAPYEEPQEADIVIDTTKMSVDTAVSVILQQLRVAGYLIVAQATATVLEAETV